MQIIKKNFYTDLSQARSNISDPLPSCSASIPRCVVMSMIRCDISHAGGILNFTVTCYGCCRLSINIQFLMVMMLIYSSWLVHTKSAVGTTNNYECMYLITNQLSCGPNNAKTMRFNKSKQSSHGEAMHLQLVINDNMKVTIYCSAIRHGTFGPLTETE